MTQLETLASLLSKKLERQTLLKEKSKELDELDLDLFGSKFVRMFGSTYLIFKRVLTLLLGIVLIFIASLLYFAPHLVLQDKALKTVLVEKGKEYYMEMAGVTLEEALVQFARNDSRFGIDVIIGNLDAAFSKAIEEKIKELIVLLAILLFILALVLLYISRLTLKMRVRNRKISKAETLSQALISNYKQTIEEEEKELELLNEILKGSFPQQEKSHE